MLSFEFNIIRIRRSYPVSQVGDWRFAKLERLIAITLSFFFTVMREKYCDKTFGAIAVSRAQKGTLLCLVRYVARAMRFTNF